MDPEGNIWFQFLFLVVLLLLSAFFSSAETALTSLNKIRLKHLSENENKKAILISSLLERPERLITTLLIGNNIVNILISVMATSLAISIWGQKSVVIMTPVITVAVIIFGEVVPKSIAAGNSEKVSFLFSYPVKILTIIFLPFVKVLTLITQLIMKIFNIDNANSLLFTVEEFKTIIDVGQKEGVFEEDEKEMLQGIVKFGDHQVREVLKTPRVDIIGIPLNSTYEEVRELIVDEQFSRYPVYSESLDNIVGLLYVKDLFKLKKEEKENFDISKIMLPKEQIIFVPETSHIGKLFKQMKRKRIHMAVVLDEYCGTLGVITLEDILETIVGEIEDESDDEEEKLIIEMNENYAIVSSNIQIHYFNDKFDSRIPNGDIETIGGFILKQLGRLPKEKEFFIWEDFKISVIEMNGSRMSIVKIEKQ